MTAPDNSEREDGPLDDPAPSSSVEYLILGAGPAGLSAALELCRHGASVLLVEKESGCGGLCRTHRRDGFSFDMGGHRFITRDREIFDSVAGLMGSNLRVAERTSVIRLGGKEYHYPLKLSEVLRGEGLTGVARIFLSFVGARFRRSPAGPSFADWTQRQFGKEIYQRFFAPYTRKLWDLDPGELSSDWAAERISRISLGDVALHALRLRRHPPRTFARRYCYPRQGIGQIFESLEAEARRLGAGCITRARVAQVKPGPPHEVRLETPRGDVEITCGRILSTIPVPELVALLPAPPEVRHAASQLSFRSLRFANLQLEGPPLSDRTWIYVPQKEYLMTRIQFPARRSPENCPPGKTSIQLEIPCNFGDELWARPREELLPRLLEELEQLGFPVRSRVIDSFDVRARHAYPVYRRDYREHLERVLSWIDQQDGIATFGRQGRFQYIFFDRAMRAGVDAARRCLGLPVGFDEPSDTSPLIPEESGSITDSLPISG